MKTKHISLLRRAVTKKMFPSEIQRLKLLVALAKQFNRLKFERTVPPEYTAAVQKIESLIPEECRELSYARFEMGAPTWLDIGETLTDLLSTAVKRSMTRNVRDELAKLVESNIWEAFGLSNVSSDTSESTTHEVPDVDEPLAKRVKD